MSMMTLTTRDEEQRPDEPTTADETEICPECGGDVHPGAGVDVTCDECGLVVDRDEIDRGAEWRYFGTEHGTSTFERCSGDTRTATMHDRGLGSSVGYNHGREGYETWQLKRMKTAHNRMTSRERVLLNGLLEVTRLASSVGVGQTVRERACTVFRECQEGGVLGGRSADAIASAALWIACREQDHPVLLRDVADPSPADERKIHHMMLVVRSELGVYALPPEPSALVPRIASECDLEPEIATDAIEIADALEATGEHGGHKPEGIAAACVYTVAKPVHGNDILQTDIAEVADVSPMTLRKNLRLLESEGLGRDD